jgi:hypothetical protein
MPFTQCVEKCRARNSGNSPRSLDGLRKDSAFILVQKLHAVTNPAKGLTINCFAFMGRTIDSPPANCAWGASHLPPEALAGFEGIELSRPGRPDSNRGPLAPMFKKRHQQQIADGRWSRMDTSESRENLIRAASADCCRLRLIRGVTSQSTPQGPPQVELGGRR